MITRIGDAAVRHRRAILLVGVILAAVQAALTALAPMSLTWLAVMALLVVLVGVAGVRRTRPAAFVVRGDAAAFTAPPAAWPVLFSLCLMVFAGDRVGSVVRSVRADDWLWVEVGIAGLQVVAVLLFVAQAWQGYDIALRPDGLYDRRSLGTLIVPWEAIPVPRPGRRPGRPTGAVFPPGAFAAQDPHPADVQLAEVRLGYVQPDLVRRRGLVWNTKRIYAVHLDARVLAGAIGFYAQHPEHRASIGTDSGYRLLHRALTRGAE
jgi:hypothetical protein